jgi:dienelactone hydrolase
VFVHGSDGLRSPWDTQIRTFAGYLAANGYVALIPHYFDSTGTSPPLTSIPPGTIRDTWVQAIDDALEYANGRTADVETGKLGSLGFSLGGHLVLRQALLGSGAQPVDAVVDFFGPIAALGGLGAGVACLPPVQIHHGVDDPLVPILESQDLVKALAAAGKKEGRDFEFYPYAKQGHGFTHPGDIIVSELRSLTFFNNHII